MSKPETETDFDAYVRRRKRRHTVVTAAGCLAATAFAVLAPLGLLIAFAFQYEPPASIQGAWMSSFDSRWAGRTFTTQVSLSLSPRGSGTSSYRGTFAVTSCPTNGYSTACATETRDMEVRRTSHTLCFEGWFGRSGMQRECLDFRVDGETMWLQLDPETVLTAGPHQVTAGVPEDGWMRFELLR